MDVPRRHVLRLAAGAVAAPTLSYPAWSQAYPSRSVRIMVGFAAGGSADIVGRLIGQWLAERTGQSFVIENRPGAGTNIATEAVVKAAPDGYTLLLITAANAINATLYGALNFNFIRDIAPVAALGHEPNAVLVNPSVPAKTIPEFIAHAKANPGKLAMASGGNGAPSHVSGELFKMMTGVNLVHVPYRGAAPALTDLIAGQVQIYFGPLLASVDHIKTGRLRVLAVTSLQRSEILPDVPTVHESVPGYEAAQSYGVGAPKGTPAEVVDRLNKEVNAALADPKMKARFAELGATVLPGSPADYGNFIAAETAKWAKVITAANLRAD
jgi:tripartite-type tricarboxylate transporter receptor subunit TctC